jgi:hypothetical protein
VKPSKDIERIAEGSRLRVARDVRRQRAARWRVFHCGSGRAKASRAPPASSLGAPRRSTFEDGPDVLGAGQKRPRSLGQAGRSSQYPSAPTWLRPVLARHAWAHACAPTTAANDPCSALISVARSCVASEHPRPCDAPARVREFLLHVEHSTTTLQPPRFDQVFEREGSYVPEAHRSVPRASDGRVTSQIPGQPGGDETQRSQQAEMIEDCRWLPGTRAARGGRAAAHAPLHSRR